MQYGITLIPGDGIGPEVTDAAVRVLEACHLHIRWDRVEAGAGHAFPAAPLPNAVVGPKNRVVGVQQHDPVGHAFQDLLVLKKLA